MYLVIIMIYNKSSLSFALPCVKFLDFFRRSIPTVLCDTLHKDGFMFF